MRVLAALLALTLAAPAQAGWRRIDLPRDDVTLRAVAISPSGAFHVSGGKGAHAVSQDGGRTWRFSAPQGEAAYDFRGVAVAGDGAVLLMTAGEAAKGDANIFRSADGVSWTKTFQTTEPGAFLDTLALRDGRRGFVLGDPVDGRWFVLRTDDGGRTWTRLPGPAVRLGEAAFAASNSALFLGPGREVWIVGGGLARARVFHSRDDGATWSASETAIEGDESAGLFGGMALGGGRAVVVGGDYRAELREGPAIARTQDGGRTWTPAPDAGTPRLLEGVARRDARTLIAVGPRGASVSRDDGATWRQVDDEAFHAIACAGATCVAAGSRGRVAVWIDD
ncbi:MAG: hypothetical protein JNK30_21810 [Phenylobacterium sp.]|uniref:WD40/YVTN/BNR-like repeat-containing protein n=1 Tax=Phenylobacterium sp. TaxID=1871053 RepID=UPI001A41CB2A|nr:hypothetical protein [Phenylobacterium sp.]MBL8774038.1 hypothetical protein [Phenylobacterium sp.]